jgi:hypothetical protein
VTTIEKLKLPHTARAFRPFDLHLADGSKVRVPHPEALA